MHLQLAEVAPAAPLVIEALPPLIILAGLLVALGLIMLIDAFVRAIFGTIASILSNVPFVGSLTSSAIHSAERAISHALGVGISGVEKRIAHQWHNLASVLSHFWHLFEQAAVNVYDLAKLLAGAATFPDVGALERRLTRRIRSAEHAAEVAILHALHNAKAFTHSVAEGVYPRLRTLEHEVTRTLPREIRHARSLAKEAERGVARLWKRVKALEATVSTSAIAAAVAAALAAVGLDWLGCRDGASRVGRSGCNLWDDLGALLGIFAAAELALHVEDVVKIIEQLSDPAVALLDKAK